MMIEVVKKQVYELLKNDDSGHDYKHIERVLNMSLKFAQKENTDLNIVSLIALLHDVDDYKLFGKEYSNNLINAKKIMNNAKVPLEIQSIVLSELSCIWYKTDTRTLDKTGDDNLFIEACFDFKIARNIDMLLDYLKEL